MDQNQNYGAKFDGPIAVAMAILIILSFIGVIALQKATHEECSAATYTYCGEKTEH